MKDRTGASQWDFPSEEDKEEELKGSEGAETQTSSQGDMKTVSAPTGGITGQTPMTWFFVFSDFWKENVINIHVLYIKPVHRSYTLIWFTKGKLIQQFTAPH